MKLSNRRKILLATSAILATTIIGAWAAGYFITAAKFSNVSVSSGYSLVSASYSVNGGAPTSCSASSGNFTCASLSTLTYGDSLSIFVEVQENNGRTTTPTAAFESSPSNAFGAAAVLYGNGATSSCTASSGSPVTVSGADQFGCAQATATVSSMTQTITAIQLDYRSA